MVATPSQPHTGESNQTATIAVKTAGVFRVVAAADTPDVLLPPASNERKEKYDLTRGPAPSWPGVREGGCLRLV